MSARRHRPFVADSTALQRCAISPRQQESGLVVIQYFGLATEPPDLFLNDHQPGAEAPARLNPAVQEIGLSAPPIVSSG
jgi:hypothetical protein